MDFNKYKNELLYPAPLGKFLNCVECEGTVEKTVKYCPNCGTYLAEVVVAREQKYKDALKAWGKREGDIFNVFKEDVLKEVGLLGHPNADKAFSYAWENGHSSGFENVYNILCDIADILL